MPRLAVSAALFLALLVPHPASPGDILGHWHGSSICVRFTGNSACNDEEVFYEFTAGADSNHVKLYAAKMVGTRPEPMYDLDFVYDPARQEWDGDFANSRVTIRWTYRIQRDTLFGEVLLLPAKQVGRHVVATRIAR
jgi:hypothetical protein